MEWISRRARPPWTTRSSHSTPTGPARRHRPTISSSTAAARSPPTSANNLLATGGNSGLTNGVNGNLVGVANPELGTLANNGGPTQTIALLTGSPAINAGSIALAVDANGNPLTTDQRGAGFPRFEGSPNNETVDIGAFEGTVAPSNPTVYTVDLTSDSGASTSALAGDILYCVTQANANGNLAGSVIDFSPTVFARRRRSP